MTDSPIKAPVARYRFIAQMKEEVLLPEYAGSLFRGQFGASLRRLSCMTKQPQCSGCPLHRTCPYPQIFEPVPPLHHPLQNFSAIPAGYVLIPPMPQKGYQQGHVGRQLIEKAELFQFEMVLIGQVRNYLPLIIYAWQQALRRGLTKGRKKAELIAVQSLNSFQNSMSYPSIQKETMSYKAANCQQKDYCITVNYAPIYEYIWTYDNPNVQSHSQELIITPACNKNELHISIQTPLRLQRHGRIIGPKELNARVFIGALARRIALLMEFHAQEQSWGAKVPHLINLSTQFSEYTQLHWFNWRRYSSRQKQEMILGGVIGKLKLQADLKLADEIWPWLWLGQWLHVGKNATFGMGAYQLRKS